MENADREAQCAQEFVRQLEQRRKAVDFLPTVSFGSAPFLGEDVLAVKNRADREMYRYKRPGSSMPQAKWSSLGAFQKGRIP